MTYHRISNRKDLYLSVSPRKFDEQMHYLANNGYRLISLDDFYKYRQDGMRSLNKVVILTFDDGYLDNYNNAFPILKMHQFTATIFLATGFVGKTYLGEKMLNWPEIKEMSNNGIDFGSHTITHPFLAMLSLDEARREIQESKTAIEESIGKNVTFFCYPSGDFNSSIKQIVKECGYIGACSEIMGVDDSHTDLFVLKRTGISPKDTLFDFKKKLYGAFDLLHMGLRFITPNKKG